MRNNSRFLSKNTTKNWVKKELNDNKSRKSTKQKKSNHTNLISESKNKNLKNHINNDSILFADNFLQKSGLNDQLIDINVEPLFNNPLQKMDLINNEIINDTSLLNVDFLSNLEILQSKMSFLKDINDIIGPTEELNKMNEKLNNIYELNKKIFDNYSSVFENLSDITSKFQPFMEKNYIIATESGLKKVKIGAIEQIIDSDD